MTDAWAAVSTRLAALDPMIDLGLARVRTALSALGNPERSLPRVVHVAGTNGKGSTLSMMRAMAVAQGLRVHVYTSPHLVHWGERIVVANTPILPGLLERLLDEIATTGVALTVFETLTVAAYMAFACTPADLTLVEVGLGGRLDATNVVEPALCVITPVDLDHVAFLGDDRAAIAREKAGIIKSGVPVVVARQEPDAYAAIAACAEQCASRMIVWGQDFDAFEQAGHLVWQCEDQLLDLPLPALYGRHQIDNAGVAVAAAIALGWSADAIAEGLRTVRWPARLQRLSSGPWARRAAAQGCELWLDGAHNPHGARAAAEFFADLDARAPKPLDMIVGILNTKDAAGVLAPFAGLARHVHAITIPGADAALAADQVADLARAAGLQATSHGSPDAAFSAALGAGHHRVAIVGSLYLAGWVLNEKAEG